MNIATLSTNAEPSRLTTIANLRDGQTIALMGLKSSAFPIAIKQLSMETLNQIPIYAGRLLRSKTLEDDREVVIFVTAHIVGADEN